MTINLFSGIFQTDILWLWDSSNQVLPWGVCKPPALGSCCLMSNLAMGFGTPSSRTSSTRHTLFKWYRAPVSYSSLEILSCWRFIVYDVKNQLLTSGPSILNDSHFPAIRVGSLGNTKPRPYNKMMVVKRKFIVIISETFNLVRWTGLMICKMSSFASFCIAVGHHHLHHCFLSEMDVVFSRDNLEGHDAKSCEKKSMKC
jgi:hypothetical protein